MSKITTHVLDTVIGKPAAGIAVKLERQEDQDWASIASAETDRDGRCANLALDAVPGTYRLTFATGAYFSQHGRTSIYPEIAITFQCNSNAHYHLPLLLSDNSYTTYRGS
ncbi:hydroxyisourate hydrolase [Telmatobacter sp. DSM 110680]|uniref:5-hydroxyisourate hydrolase n=1 Tax=Telmatobacter sp. DSM 110680 TaxID=3036704 RepID=A0AAU7DPC7_9BACT